MDLWRLRPDRPVVLSVPRYGKSVYQSDGSRPARYWHLVGPEPTQSNFAHAPRSRAGPQLELIAHSINLNATFGVQRVLAEHDFSIGNCI